jgi:hypothetical protein
MILRRLSQSLKQQNWAAIWIEFVLLIAGVFLGIQVSNWNEERTERLREAEFIERLSRDFKVIDARLTENSVLWGDISTATLNVLGDLRSHQNGNWHRPKSEILWDLNIIPNSRIPAPRAATYVELLSAGQLGFIRDSKLRDALLEYDMQVGYVETGYSLLMRRVEPHVATLLSHLEFDGKKDNSNIQISVKNEPIWVDVDLEGMAADPKMKLALNMFASASRNQLSLAKQQQDKASVVLALLKSNSTRNGAAKP